MPTASVGTQMVVAVLVGLLTAFAVQFLLTNLGLALGISVLKLKYRPQTSESSESKGGKTIAKISFLAGIGILLTLNSVLFIACFLAVRFSTASDPISGATLGIVIWSTYFLILLWVSYSAVGSILGWVFGSVATKLRQLIEAISTLISGTEEPDSKLLTEAAAADIINQEIQTALNEFDLKQRIEDYLRTITQPKLDSNQIAQEFADLLEKLDLKSLAGTNQLPKIERQNFIDLINKRTNLSPSDAEEVVNQLEKVWQQAVNRYSEKDLNRELLQFLQSANPKELQFEQLINRLKKLLDKKSPVASTDSTTWWGQIDWRTIKNALLNRVDLSEVDLEDIWHTLQSLYHQIDSSEALPKLPFNTIRNDVEDYLWHAPPWYLKSEKGWQEFKEIIYDPQAEPAQVRSRLKQIQFQDLMELLQQRDDLDSKEIEEIAEYLEVVRKEVVSLIEVAEWQEQQQQLNEQLKNYLQTVEQGELQGDNLLQRIEELLVESGFRIEVLTKFLSSWQQVDWQTWLQQRQDLEPEELQQTAEELKQIGTSLLEKVEQWQVQITSMKKELQDKLESYLRYTHLEHLTPEKIDAKLEQVWQEGCNNLPALQQPLPQIDRSPLLEILERRKGLDVERVKEIVEQIATKLSELNHSSTQKISQLQVQSAELSEKLLDYLSQAIEKNLNLAEIEQDLPQLLTFAKGKTSKLINQQLAQLNWDEIEAKLQQVQTDSEGQIKRTIKQLREAVRKLIKLPRRWAIRTSKQVKDVTNELEDFLSYGNKREFTSEHLERNLNSIFNRAKTRAPSLRDSTTNTLDRLAQLTPDQITKSLSLRDDLTPVEIEQISDRFITKITQLSEEIKTKQHQIEEYLSSLNLWDYERIKASLATIDFSSLIDSGQEMISNIPLTELGDRLGKLSYESLETIIQANNLDSLLPQIQGIPEYISEQIETIKLAAYEKTENIKKQTLQQVEATRKAIASAAYWLFAITFTSAVSSAVAGFLATRVAF